MDEIKRRTVLGVTLAGFAAYLGLEHLFSEKEVVVPTGKIRHAYKKPLTSSGFVLCSGLILDYGNGAVMAHALPTDTLKDKSLRSPDHVYTDSVVQASVDLLDRENIPLQNVEAIVHAGEVEGLNRILSDLREREIPIRSFHVEPEESNRKRDLDYDPTSDNLSVKYKPFYKSQ